MKRIIVCVACTLMAHLLTAQNNPLWMRYPAISPDGKTIVFGYKGDLYKVPASGGDAIAITLHEAYEYMPVWSHDGKSIAFASDRYGNFDVFVMPSSGGEATRLTYHSANDIPYDFTPDNKSVLFGTNRNDIYTSARFPQRSVFSKLYEVPVTGGRSVMYLSAGSEFARFSSKGDKVIFQDRKGYEDPFRKHHTSAVTRDIWMYDINKKSYTQLSDFAGEDREPVFAADDNAFYFLSEKDGSQNIYTASLTGKDARPITSLKNHPVRNLSRDNNNTLCFSYNGELYTMTGQQPQKVLIRINTDSRTNTEKVLPVNTGVTGLEISPNGKELAFIVRGEVFVTSVEGGTTKRITNTPEQERTVVFTPDGRSLIYAAERNGSWNIYKTTISRSEEKYFYASTVLKEEPLIATDADEFQPVVSHDGKEIAYLEERNIVKIHNIESKKSRTIVPAGVNFSYSDGDQDYVWSPDDKWLSFTSDEGRFGNNEVDLVKADGSGKRLNLTQSGFNDNKPKWAMGGRVLLWLTDRDGKKPLAEQGATESDVYAMFFDQAVYDSFKLSKDDYALMKERTEKEIADKSAKKDTIATKPMTVKQVWEPKFDDIDMRKLRLTIASGNISDYFMSSDGEKLLYLAKVEKGFDLWMTSMRTRETKIVAKLEGGPAGLEVSKDGKSLFVLSDGKILKVDQESGKTTPVLVNGEMYLNAAAERAYIFDHAWRQVSKKLYDPKIGGLDWKLYHDAYARFLPHINNNFDFQELLSELLGELNVSHTGGRYTQPQLNTDVTASLGMLYDETYTGNGVRVEEILLGGPVVNAKTRIKRGAIIEKIDDEAITDSFDWSRLLNRKTGKNILMSLYEPATKIRWDETLKPISQAEEQSLLYQRWVKMERKKVDELSGGKIGYVHVQSMNDLSFRTVYEDVLGKSPDKQALIVDTRFNGGGWLHDDLVTFLAGRRYLNFAPQGVAALSGEPRNKWTNPSCVLMSESNYSDAFIFPYAYKSLGIGKLVGMPVAGTGTAVWWETQIDPTLVFGIPMVATIGKENRPTENLQLEPDVKVRNDYAKVLNGEDQQLAVAVQEMLEAIKNAPRKAF